MLTTLPVALVWAVVEVVAFAAAPLGAWTLGVEKPLEGFEPGACWMSLPCSAMRAGASLTNSDRSFGTSFDLTASLTGCFSLESE